MFSLHETTQRRVCRVLFVVCCVVPTLLTLGWIAYYYRPWRLSDWQQTLSQQLHLRATVDQASSPRPGLTILKNVHLAHLRTEDTLGRLDELECRWHNSRLLLRAKLLEIEVAQLPQVANAMATWMSGATWLPIDVEVEQIVFLGGPFESAIWQNLRLTGESSTEQQRHMILQVDTAETDSPLQLVLQRSGTSILAALDTQQTSLPVWLLTDLVPGGLHRSPAASFSGNMQIEWHSQQQKGNLQGQFDQIELAEWLSATTPLRQLIGKATLQLSRYAWQGKRIQLAAGELQAGSGTANRAFLAAASYADHLKCVPTQALHDILTGSSVELQPFDQLIVNFQLDHTGLTLKGQNSTGILLTQRGEPLLLEPPQKLPLAHLVLMFHLPAIGWLPDTQAAHNMASELPLPKSLR